MTSVTAAVAKREAASITTTVEQYRNDFAQVLPSHVAPDTWVRIAVGALRRDENLRAAATNDPGSLMAALLQAARLGLEPGTEQYYLTPRKVQGSATVLGIVGYQGLVQLMYRAGAVSSVIVECVYSLDKFSYVPGRDARPIHEIDWDASLRGELRLVYAYAVMKDGATSKVVVLNRADIERIKKSSQGASGTYSPWQQHEAAMWMKSAARQLAKWVPTSAEYLRSQVRAVSQGRNEATPRMSDSLPPVPAGVDDSTGEIVDGVLVEDAPAPEADELWPAAATPGGAE